MDAAVGDDVYGEDPTVNQLQSTLAAQFGKEAGLFVPSGTMSNLLAIAAHCGRGEEVLAGDEQHIVVYEQGGASALFGIVYHTLPQWPDGTFALTGRHPSLEYAIESRHGGKDIHYSRPSLVCIENTHNRCGGAVLPQDWVDECAAIAHRHGLKVRTTLALVNSG